MGFIEQLDPEIAAVVETIPSDGLLNWKDLTQSRALVEAWAAEMPDLPDVVKEDRSIPGSLGGPEVLIRVYRPASATGRLPGLLWIHGGGMVVGSIAMDDHPVQRIVHAVGCLVVSVGYRLAPEHPYPAPLEDCYAAITWTHTNAEELGIHPDGLAVGGMSAGGGIGAGLTLLARDRGEVPVTFQWLIYPMLDDRNITPSSHAITDSRTWNRELNLKAWRAYLGTEPGGHGVSPYAAPARATDLSNLPPAYIQVGSQDLFLGEDTDYALRLAHAGVPVELHIYPGACHGSDTFALAATLSKRMVADRFAALRRALFPEQMHRESTVTV